MNFAARREILEYCAANQIIIQAYGSLFSGHEEFLSNPAVAKPGKRTQRTPAQVIRLLRTYYPSFHIIFPTVTGLRTKNGKTRFRNSSTKKISS